MVGLPRGPKSASQGIYANLYTAEPADVIEDLQPQFSQLSNADLRALNRPVLELEIKSALCQMAPNKALDPNGLSAGFFQKNWNIIGKDVVIFIKGVFETGIFSS